MAVAVEGVDMSPGPVGERDQALKHYFLATFATLAGAGQARAGSWARWVRGWRHGAEFYPLSVAGLGGGARSRYRKPGRQVVEGEAETGLFRRACGRPWASRRWGDARGMLGQRSRKNGPWRACERTVDVVTGTKALALDHLERRLEGRTDAIA